LAGRDPTWHEGAAQVGIPSFGRIQRLIPYQIPTITTSVNTASISNLLNLNLNLNLPFGRHGTDTVHSVPLPGITTILQKQAYFNNFF
jgi:hypothetical protein